MDENVPKVIISDNGCSPWIDREVIQLIPPKKNSLRQTAKRTDGDTDVKNFVEVRREVKRLIQTKYNEYLKELTVSLTEYPKRFWAFLKARTRAYSNPAFLKHGKKFVSNCKDKPNLLNNYFHYVFLIQKSVLSLMTLTIIQLFGLLKQVTHEVK